MVAILCAKHDGKCPRCGTPVHLSQLVCPSCGLEIRWHHGNDYLCAECSKEKDKTIKEV